MDKTDDFFQMTTPSSNKGKIIIMHIIIYLIISLKP